MSQWGIERTVNGARFVPHVNSPPFTPISVESAIESIALLDDGGEIEVATKTSAELSESFCGKPYSIWLAAAQEDSQRKPSILERLELADVFKVQKNADGTFSVVEMCDEHFEAQLTKEDLIALADELRALAACSDAA